MIPLAALLIALLFVTTLLTRQRTIRSAVEHLTDNPVSGFLPIGGDGSTTPLQLVSRTAPTTRLSVEFVTPPPGTSTARAPGRARDPVLARLIYSVVWDDLEDDRSIRLLVRGEGGIYASALQRDHTPAKLELDWLNLTPVLLQQTAEEIPRSALLRALHEPIVDQLLSAMKRRPIELERLSRHGNELVLAWLLYHHNNAETYPLHNPRALRLLTGQVARESESLAQGLRALPPTAQVAAKLIRAPHNLQPARVFALRQLLRRAETPDEAEGASARVAVDELLAHAETMDMDMLTLWAEVDPTRLTERLHDRLDALLQRTEERPAWAWPPVLRRLVATIAIARHGEDAPWALQQDTTLSAEAFAALLDDAADTPDARCALAQRLIQRLREDPPPGWRACALTLGADLTLSGALLSLDEAERAWLERRMMTTLREAIHQRDEITPEAAHAGQILRFVGAGPALSMLRDLHDSMRRAPVRREALRQHLTILEARLAGRANHGALTLASDHQHGQLTLSDEETGALTVAEPPPPDER